MKNVDDLYEPYIELEQAIHERMNLLFPTACGECTACCCRADICEEVLHSAFLTRLLERQGHSARTMDDRFGWLQLDGCSLEYGRPPVCYAFFCDDLLDGLPDEETRRITRIMGKLLHYVGLNADGEHHLVEIVHPDALQKIDIDSLAARLEEAYILFNEIETYFQTGRLSARHAPLLQRIEHCADL